MISCQQLVDFCLDYIEGDLPRDQQVGFMRHLAQCPDCVAFFETYRQTAEISREALKIQMPPAVKEAIHSFLRCRRDEG